jgi:hypothetical protein
MFQTFSFLLEGSHCILILEAIETTLELSIDLDHGFDCFKESNE